MKKEDILLKKSLINFLLLFTFVSLYGCAADIVQRYSPSSDLAIDLEDNFSKYGKKVKIGTVEGCNQFKPLCRLYGKIVPPENGAYTRDSKTAIRITEGFCVYIKNAFIVELKRAKLFSSNADIDINLEFEEIEFNSIPVEKDGYFSFTDGYWKYTVKISSKNIEPFSISSTYGFSTSLFAYDACEQVADSFPGSIEKLLKDITNNPKFLAIFSNHKK